jgi:uncharacterized protein (DUF58 family)
MGDDVRFIDWIVSARTGELHIKRFVEERELTVLIAVDVSPSMAFGTWSARKQQVAAQIAMAIALTAVQNKDRVGLVVFSDRVHRYIPPKKGRKHVLRIVSELLSYERGASTEPATAEEAPARSWWGGLLGRRTPRPRPPEREWQTDIGSALQFVGRISRRRAVVFLLSDFVAPPFERDLRIASQRHDVVPLVLRDANELGFGDLGGMLVLTDLESGRERVHDPRAGDAAHRAEAVRQLEETEQTFRRLRLDAARIVLGDRAGRLDEASLTEEQLTYVEPLVELFRRRARRH